MLNLGGKSAAILRTEVKLGDARELALDLGEHCGVCVAAFQACVGTTRPSGQIPFLLTLEQGQVC